MSSLLPGPGGCGHESDECDCSCHDDGGQTQHCVPCCRLCEHCGKNIISAIYEEHVIRCLTDNLVEPPQEWLEAAKHGEIVLPEEIQMAMKKLSPNFVDEIIAEPG